MRKSFSLKEFGTKYFDKRKKTRGNRNPVRRVIGEKEFDAHKKEMEAKLASGEFNHLLDVCGITGAEGRFGETIRPAIIKLSKDGGFDTLRTLIVRRAAAGKRPMVGPHKHRTVLSIKFDGVRAKVRLRQDGFELIPYVHIYQER